MALTTIVRRAASRVVPLAARAFQANPGSSYHSFALFATVNRLRTTDLASVLFKPSFPWGLRSFHSQPGSDERLIDILRKDIRYDDDYDMDYMDRVVYPRDFPFEIEDYNGERIFTLTREYKNEQITVEVPMSNVFFPLENNGEPFGLSLVVRISKNEGPCLEFACVLNPYAIFISRLSVKNPNSTTDEDQIITCEGPSFSQLGRGLHNGFCKYLEKRGIKPSIAKFLHDYMHTRDFREYCEWMDNVEKLLEAYLK